jgi:hypothetical protein
MNTSDEEKILISQDLKLSKIIICNPLESLKHDLEFNK